LAPGTFAHCSTASLDVQQFLAVTGSAELAILFKYILTAGIKKNLNSDCRFGKFMFMRI
jgi:hypothetical protein